MHHLLLTVLVLALLLISCALFVGEADGADDGTSATSTSFEDGDLTYTVLSDTEKTVSITGSKEGIGSVDFVETVTYGGTTYYVKTITGSGEGDAYKGAFQGQTSLTSVILPNYITSIGAKAFSGCTGLIKFDIGVHLSSTGAEAFKGCTALPCFSGSSGTGAIQSIGQEAFSGCVKLERFTIGSDATSIGANAFTDCGTSTSNKGIILRTFRNIDDGTGKGMFEGASIYRAEFGPSVTAIGAKAFKDCETLSEVSGVVGIPCVIQSIGEEAFSGCKKLGSFTIGAKVTSVGAKAFKDCETLSDVSWASSPGAVQTIGQEAFSGCKKLSSFTIGADVTSVGADAFKDCGTSTSYEGISLSIYCNIGDGTDKGMFEGMSDINSVSIESGVETIGKNAFKDCTGLSSLSLPTSLKTIGEGAFKGCKALYSVSGLSSTGDMTAIGEEAFSGCKKLGSFTIGAKVTSVGANAFYDCGTDPASGTEGDGIILHVYCNPGKEMFKGASVCVAYLKAGVTSIGEGAFRECSMITAVDLPNVRSIGNYAFENCSALTQLHDPYSVEKIGEGAFKGCTKITSVDLPDLVDFIGNSAFSGTGLTSISIPRKIASIGDGTFYNCTQLTEVTFSGDHVTTIGASGATDSNGAFQGCTKLKSISLPSGLASIGDYAFSGTGLASVTVPSGTKDIGGCAFKGCTSMESATIGYTGSELGSVGGSAFEGCTALTDVVIGKGIGSIDADAFKDCTSLKEIALGAGITSLDSSAFDGCSGMKVTVDCKVGANFMKGAGIEEVVIGDGVTEIGENAFVDCTNLAKVTIGKGVASIGNGAFSGADEGGIAMTIRCGIGDSFLEGCTFISSAAIEGSAASIGKSAFDGCMSLKAVRIGDGVVSIGEYAFRMCTSLTDITIGKDVSSVGESAFSGIGDGVTATVSCSSIPARLFYNVGTLKTVELGSTVGSIGDYAFQLTGISEITIPAGVTSIGKGAFLKNGSLGTVTFASPAALSGDGAALTIGEYAFAETGIAAISIPDRVTSIGKGAFMGNGSLGTVKFDPSSVLSGTENVLTIGEHAFSETGITAISIPDRVTSIGAGAFAGCDSLRSISFGTGIETVAENAFGKDDMTPTSFYKDDDVSKITFSADLDEFEGRTFTGDIKRMVREESYTLTFDPDNGTEPWRKILKPRAMIEEPAEPEKTGHDFQYWMRADGTRFDFDTETMPAEDMTLRALWKPIVLTVTYVTGTGTDPTQDCEYGSRIALPDGESGSIVISRPGYRLTGWQDGDETYLPGDTYTVTSDVSFTAVWKAVPASVPAEDDDYYNPTVVPGGSTGSSESGASVTAVAIAAGCAAVLALLTALVYAPKR